MTLIAEFIGRNKIISEVVGKLPSPDIHTNNIEILTEKKEKKSLKAEIKQLNSINTIFLNKENLEIVFDIIPKVSNPIESLQIIKYNCGEKINKYSPLIFDRNTNLVYKANYYNENHFKKYIGISLGNYNIGEEVIIQVSGIISDVSFNFSMDQELYIGNYEITQDVSNNNIKYQQLIGNVLTPNVIYLAYYEPISLI